MATKFIKVTDIFGEGRLINTNKISTLFNGVVYIGDERIPVTKEEFSRVWDELVHETSPLVKILRDIYELLRARLH